MFAKLVTERLVLVQSSGNGISFKLGPRLLVDFKSFENRLTELSNRNLVLVSAC